MQKLRIPIHTNKQLQQRNKIHTKLPKRRKKTHPNRRIRRKHTKMLTKTIQYEHKSNKQRIYHRNKMHKLNQHLKTNKNQLQ